MPGITFAKKSQDKKKQKTIHSVEYQESVDLFIGAKIDEFVKKIEEGKVYKFKGSKIEIKLIEDIAELYAISMVVDGKINELKRFLDIALEQYPESFEIQNINNQLNIYEALKAQPSFLEGEVKDPNEIEEQYIEVNSMIQLYQALPAADKRREKLKDKIRSKLLKITEIIPYFPSYLEYLIEFNQDRKFDIYIEKTALSIVKNKSSLLFPKTMDFYRFACAYKVLAILSLQENDQQRAKQFIKLAQQQISKMRSIWLIADSRIYNKVLKTKEREVKLGYVFPQWIYQLRKTYGEYLQ